MAGKVKQILKVVVISFLALWATEAFKMRSGDNRKELQLQASKANQHSGTLEFWRSILENATESSTAVKSKLLGLEEQDRFATAMAMREEGLLALPSDDQADYLNIFGSMLRKFTPHYCRELSMGHELNNDETAHNMVRATTGLSPDQRNELAYLSVKAIVANAEGLPAAKIDEKDLEDGLINVRSSEDSKFLERTNGAKLSEVGEVKVCNAVQNQIANVFNLRKPNRDAVIQKVLEMGTTILQH